jgi:hypothetical protein
MNINCTVIIQICNFFLAWAIVERILLRAVLEKLIFKKKTESDFLNSIEKEQQDIIALEHIQKEHWQNLNKYCLQNMPSLKKSNTPLIIESYLLIDEIDVKSIDTLSQSYATCIMQWLKEIR